MNKVVGIISNPDKTGTVETASKLLTCLSAFKDVDFLLDQNLSDALSLKNRYASDADMAKKVHLVVVLGGDGTLLCSVKRIREDMTPFLGINHGGLGFLAEFKIEHFEDVVRDLLKGVLTLEKRMMLDVKLVRANSKTDEAEVHYEALNDCVLTKGFFSRVLHFEVYINDQFLNTYNADGFIVATPTGSTAYSLSCGGPLVAPDTEVLILTPISPHTLSNRPLIVGADKLIKVMLKEGDKEVGLTIDGQIGRVLKECDFVEVSKSKRYVHMVKSGYDYFEILREKLGWRGTSA